MNRRARAAVLAGGAWAIASMVVAWRRGRMAGRVPFDGIRRVMNRSVNPWLVSHRLTGGHHSEIGMVEHVGRVTGATHLTPVHPTFVGDAVFIPVPYGSASQWARNVLAAGQCRLTIHERAYLLDRPTMVESRMNPQLGRLAARLAGWLGVMYLRLDRDVGVDEQGDVAGEVAAA